MLTITKIRKLLSALNDELAKKDVKGEIGLCGGAVMCLVFNTRPSTKDIDAIFHPTQIIRESAARVAKQHGLHQDWLNDAAKSYFHVDPPKETVIQLSHLRVWAPSADYMLAMKCISARFDARDRDDVEFIIRYLEIDNAERVFEIISRYYPDQMIPPKTRFFVEEVVDSLTASKTK